MVMPEAPTPDCIHIPVFAGHGAVAANLIQAREQATRDAQSLSGTMLLTLCFEAFQTELATLSFIELQEAEISPLDFTEPASLLWTIARYTYNPIISGTGLFLVQALRYLSFILANAKDGNPFAHFEHTLDERIGVLGFSSGIMPACVVSASRNTHSYIFHAVEAFRLAFWMGIRSFQFKKLAYPQSTNALGSQLPWSLVCVGLSKTVIQHHIASFENNRRARSILHITAVVDDQNVTVSGHPDHLEEFSFTISTLCTIHRTTVDTLYHSPTHAPKTRTQVLSDATRRHIRFPDFGDVRCPPRSTFNGHIISIGQGYASLVEAVIDMVLVHPVNWDLVIKEIVKISPPDIGLRLVNFGPGNGLARSVEKALSNANISSVDATLDSCNNQIEDLPSPFQPKQAPIAIVGMAVHMPGAMNANELWEILERGINTISGIPADRFRVSSYTTSTEATTTLTMKARTGNFIAGHDEFDHKFFNTSPREARSMDPQQRILLHTAYEALENAGYVPDATPSFQRNTFGCFIGAATQDYADNLKDEIDVYYSTGTLKAFLSGRISYAMQFGGPSLVVDTACSSSMVAFYQACRALMNGDCTSAIAGGVNIMTSPNMFLGLDRAHFLSPTGQCKAFDASADGYSRSEGCGLFILKRLADAVAESDHILGVIRGIEVNQSGLSHSITNPHAPSQAALFKKLVEVSGINPSRISVIEAHGTGTQAGDSCELDSIRSVFARSRTSDNPLHISSIKANIGHLEAASGAAGLAKLLLMLRHNTIPAQISLKTLNPKIAPLDEDHTVIGILPCQWIPGKSPRFAILNNFGAAGSNGALVLEEHVAEKAPDANVTACVVGLSAKSEAALERLRTQYIQWLRNFQNKDIALNDIAYTATARRQIYPYRLAVTGSNKEEISAALETATSDHANSCNPRVVFVFSGQGSQYLGMASSLYSTSPVFRHQVDKCHAFLVANGFPGVLQIISTGPSESGLANWDEFEAFQAAVLVLQYALSKLWINWGVVPSAVIGHSLGEYAALVTAEVLTIESALYLVAHRARLMRRHCFNGSTGMLAANLDSNTMQELLRQSEQYRDLCIACVNTTSQCTVSGPLDQLMALKSYLTIAKKRRSLILEVPLGYHSDAMQPLVSELDTIAQNIHVEAPTIPIASNVLGTVVSPGDKSVFDQSYFSRHCVHPVLFAQGVEALTTIPNFRDNTVWLEIGPHTPCLPMLKSILKPSNQVKLLPSLRKDQDARNTLTFTLSQLYLTSNMYWRRVFAELSPGTCIDLPSYPFETQKFSVPYTEDIPNAVSNLYLESKPPHLVGEYTMLHSWVQYPSHLNGSVAIFEIPLRLLENYIQGHKVTGYALCPASVYIEQALAGADLAKRHMALDFGNSMPVLRGVQFAKPLVYRQSVTRIIVIHVTIHGDGTGIFSVTSRLESTREESVHVQGEIRFRSTRETTTDLAREMPHLTHQITAINSLREAGMPESFTTRAIYEVLFPRVVEYSKQYHTIQSLALSSNGMDGVALVQLPSSYDQGPFAAHPVFVDTLLHVAGFIANMQGDGNDAYICSEVGEVKVISTLLDYQKPYTVHCTSSWMSFENLMVADAFAIQESTTRQIVAHLKGIQFRRVRLISLTRGLSLAADPMVIKTRRRTDSNAIISPVSPRSVIFARSRSNTQSTERFPGAQKGGPHIFRRGNDTQSSSDLSSPRTLVSDDEYLEQHTPPSNDRVRGILSHVLGLELQELDDNSDFQSVGLDSLTSIEAVQAFKSEMELSLPNNVFLMYPTFASFTRFIAKLLETKEHSGHLGMLRMSLETLRGGLFSNDMPAHIQHCDDDRRLPLFLIHDGSGLVNYYEHLPPLGRNIWGLSNPRFATGETWDNLPSMGHAYTEIVKKTIGGPVILGGWSFGGVVAFEASRQLMSQGIAVKGVILIDSPSPVAHAPLSQSIVDFITRHPTRDIAGDTERLVKTQFRLNSELLGNYTPLPNTSIDPPLILLRSNEAFSPEGLKDIPSWLSQREDPRLAVAGWEHLTGAFVKILDIPGNHFEPFHALHIEEVSVQIDYACSYLESL
ncbi:putative polyketide synthase [Hygrophoropsis aurantiaca]|uniref:Polyketide synthase n=1 Tax=Hygrophoropsis aurantiaca TaxID=72124 RepID=A0ACB8A7J3_9AGAM|nr:putative polyketide synthase [Hygrophoropsis aurantiaca]